MNRDLINERIQVAPVMGQMLSEPGGGLKTPRAPMVRTVDAMHANVRPQSGHIGGTIADEKWANATGNSPSRVASRPYGDDATQGASPWHARATIDPEPKNAMTVASSVALSMRESIIAASPTYAVAVAILESTGLFDDRGSPKLFAFSEFV